MLIDSLPVGFRLNDQIRDEEGALLLDSGVEITADFVAGLRDCGIRSVEIVSRDFHASISGAVASEPAVPDLLTSVSETLQSLAEMTDGLRRDHPEPYSEKGMRALQLQLERTRETIEKSFKSLRSGNTEQLGALQKATGESILSIADDVDMTIHQAIGFAPDGEANQRLQQLAIQNSILALAVGIEVGTGFETLLHLGTAAMLCDVALYQETDDASAPAAFPVGSAEYREHPQRGFEILRELKTIPNQILRAVYEHHEQADGSGFPRGLVNDQISDAARILCVTQAYGNLTCPGDGSAGFVPADTIAYLIHHTTQGKFDLEVMLALVRTLSVYPIGSQVELTNQKLATVLRSSGSHSMRPIVQTEAGIFDLRDVEFSIAQPVVSEGANQKRLTVDLLNKVLW